MAKTRDIQIRVPDAASDEAIRLAEEKAKEAVVLVLQNEAHHPRVHRYRAGDRVTLSVCFSQRISLKEEKDATRKREA